MRRLLPLFATGFLIASLLIWLFGDSGLRAMGRLERYRRDLEANVESLRERNAALEADRTRLHESVEANELAARDIGLYRPGDRVIRIDGLSVRRGAFEVGSLLRMKRPSGTHNPFFKIAGIGSSAALVVLALALRRRESRGRPNGHRRR
jgi:cell division protein FtsB